MKNSASVNARSGCDVDLCGDNHDFEEYPQPFGRPPNTLLIAIYDLTNRMSPPIWIRAAMPVMPQGGCRTVRRFRSIEYRREFHGNKSIDFHREDASAPI
ncbi:hypothetical protein E4U33_001703 [Claviceps sp. LM78 group G4]|nr:hypothetical protein E4U33_001703 [Claviceps sp. LM78 group G4]